MGRLFQELLSVRAEGQELRSQLAESSAAIERLTAETQARGLIDNML